MMSGKYQKEQLEIEARLKEVTETLNESYEKSRGMECTECEMSAPGAYDIDIEADDINVIDTATVIWEIA